MNRCFQSAILTFIGVCLLALSAGAQQANWWYFGDHVGLDFSSGIPVEVADGQTSEYAVFHTEGSACISDAAGNLLFYSNGNVVWNKNHEIMPNGGNLAGDHSSTHAALILPVPGSNHRYYLFVTDSFLEEPQTGPTVYVVDMCMDNGLGDIDLVFGGQQIHDEFTEKMAVTRHANGTDYWLVTHITLSNEFRAFQVTAEGLSTPVSSFVGAVHADEDSVGVGVAIGQMKFSPDGQRLALTAANGLEFAEVFDFDSATGQLTNPIHLTMELGGYGIAFSLDASKLYVRGFGGLFQFNLEAGTPADINFSKTEIVTGGTNQLSGLQLGPDGKIYAIAYFTSSISVIHSPNEFYPDCDFELHAIVLENPGLSFSFPSFLDSFNYPAMERDCSGNTVEEENVFGMSVFPNPSSGRLSIERGSLPAMLVSVVVHDMLGKEVFIANLALDQSKTLELGFLPDGTYQLMLVIDQKMVFSEQIVLLHGN
jgi:hypothetical protein